MHNYTAMCAEYPYAMIHIVTQALIYSNCRVYKEIMRETHSACVSLLTQNVHTGVTQTFRK